MPIAKKGNQPMSSAGTLRSRAILPFLCIFLLCLSFLVPPAWTAEKPAPLAKDLRVIRITPSGTEAPVGRQLVIQFDRPVVPLGKMERTTAEVGITD